MGLFGPSAKEIAKEIVAAQTVIPPTPPAEEDPQKVLARQMAEDARASAAELAQASSELANERRLLQAHQRRQEAEAIRKKREGTTS